MSSDSNKVQTLFDLLRDIEQRKRVLSPRDFEREVLAATGYAPRTWHTYRTKYLDGVLIFPSKADPVLLCVRGAEAITVESFAALMTQSKRGMTEDSWRAQIRALAAAGRDKKFMLLVEDKPLFTALFEKQRSLF